MTFETWSSISNVAGTTCYVLLTVLLFQRSHFLEKPLLRRIYLPLLILSLVGPPVLCGSLRFFRGDGMSPQWKGLLLADGLLSWYGVGLMLLAIPVIRHLDRRIQAKMQAMQNESLKPQQKLVVPAVGSGCAIPLILFLIAIIVLLKTGVHLGEHNPSFDSPQPVVERYGVDLVMFFDRLAGSIMLSVIPIILLTMLTPLLRKESRRHYHFRITLIELVVIVVIITGLAAMLLPAVKAAKESGRRSTCEIRMKRLAFALHEYRETYGTLPPAYTVDENGDILHSWRVLLLPFLDRQALYGQIRLDEPWDSEHNRRFHETQETLFPFRCPNREGRNTFFVSYYVTPETQRDNCDYSFVVGEGTLFPGGECRGFDDLTDAEKATTVLCTERRTPICWMDPTREITLETFRCGIDRSNDGPGSEAHPGATILYADDVVVDAAHVVELIRSRK